MHENKVKNRVISYYLACHVNTVRFWINRDKLQDMSRPGRPVIYSQATHLSLIGFYCQSKPLSECGRWTIRLAEKYLETQPDITGTAIPKSTIHRILQANNLKPHLSKYFLHITNIILNCSGIGNMYPRWYLNPIPFDLDSSLITTTLQKVVTILELFKTIM